MSPNGFAGNPAGFAGRAKRDEFYRSGHNPGRWTYVGGTSSGTVRAFGSGNAPDGGHMEGMFILGPLEHSVLEMALDGGLMKDWSVLEPLEHSVLEVARNDRPMAGISVLEPFEHSVPEVTLVWSDCSLIEMSVSDPLEHSGLGVTVHVDMDSLWMAPWDAGGILRSGYRPGMAIWRDVLCCVVRLSCMPVLPATGYLRSFGGLGRTCIIDLHAGESTAPVEMLGDFPRSQFPPGGVGVLPSTSVTLMSDNS